ncbi:MAG: hypothetical protein FWF77_06245 [Defluviitaleaceae bacterium]|nr:hypothetical protein [Defluviitaleaceae bacterium]
MCRQATRALEAGAVFRSFPEQFYAVVAVFSLHKKVPRIASPFVFWYNYVNLYVNLTKEA